MSEFEKIKVIFSKYDADGSGDISPKELSSLLRTLNPSFTAADCDKLFQDIDVDDNGKIDSSEWVEWLQDTSGANKGAKAGVMLTKDKSGMVSAESGPAKDTRQRARLRGKFAQLDVDGSGTLDFQEVYSFLNQRFPDMTLPDLRFLYECSDKSNDGALDFYELLDMLVTLPAHKLPPGQESAAAPSLLYAVMMRDDEDEFMKKAWEKHAQDQKEILGLVNGICDELKKETDENRKYLTFRDEYAKTLRDHYAKTGQLRY